MSNHEKVAIIGAGIGGLTAGYELMQRDVDVTVFEAADQPGGAIRTIHRDEWTFEMGPNTLLDRGGVISRQIAQLGLQAEQLYPSSTSNTRYIVRDGIPRALPMSPGELRRTKLFSTSAKLRLLREPLIPPRIEPELDESLYNFVARRLGEEFVEYALDPFLAGTYAGKPEQLSSRYALKRLKELELASGSLFKGALGALGAKRKARKAGQKLPPRAKLINFRGGVQTLTDALAEALGERIHTGSPITQLTQHEDGRWKLKGRRKHTKDLPPFDRVLCALPAHVIGELKVSLARGGVQDMSAFARIEHPPVTILAMGFRRDQIAHSLDGFGLLIPSKEPFEHLGAVFASTIFTDRTPRGHVMLVTFFGGARNPEAGLWPQEKQVEVATRELGELLGLKGQPVHVERRCWEQAIPQYEVGYEHIMTEIEALESHLPGLTFTGNWRGGIAVPDVVAQATHCAHSIADSLHL